MRDSFNAQIDVAVLTEITFALLNSHCLRHCQQKTSIPQRRMICMQVIDIVSVVYIGLTIHCAIETVITILLLCFARVNQWN